ncbi:MAG: hypothetical protein OXE74_09900, partial [Cyanobacteria bacterium MAG CAR2_bin_4]|nr:hypothetical protein [Cyanobacteria bacterium MAG CAR2_bin_4]
MPVLEGKLLFLWCNRLPAQGPVHPDGAPLLQHIRRSLGVSAFWPVFPVLWPGRRHSPQLDQPAG